MARPARKIYSDHPLWEKVLEQGRSSGLSDEQVIKLGWTPLTAEEVQARLGTDKPQAGGMLLPYFDLSGQPTQFFRIRYLEKLPGFAGIVEKPQRYVQPAKTLNEVYLPPLLPAPWKEIAEDASLTIYFTEGCKKAAAGCAHGLPTLGLGGVDVFRSTKRGIELLPQLAAIKWENRNVVIVYDSDAATNPNVVRAQRSLASCLVGRGALPAVASLPPTAEGGKQGLDDFLLAAGPEALIKILQDAPPFPEAEALWELNEEIVYVNDPGFVVVQATGQRMDPNRFAAHHYANRHYLAIEMKNNVAIAKKKKLAPRWMEWEHRNEVERITYAPGQPRLVDGALNVWPGWGCVPKKGDVGPWSGLLDHLFKGEPEFRQWFERWCAYPLQHPGTKMYSAAVIWGAEKGTGKTLAAYSLMGIYGRNAIEIKNKDLKGGFNSWAENRQFIYGDEISGNEARVDAEWLKGLITQAWVRINAKFMPEFVIPDCMNYYMASNKPDTLYVETGDRRYGIHEVTAGKLSQEFYDHYDEWLMLRQGRWHGPGAPALFHHLLHLDLGDFHPRSQPPVTSSKEAMIRHSASDIGLWTMKLREDPGAALLPLGETPARECDLYTARQLLNAYDPERKGRVSEGGLGRALSSTQIRQVYETQPVTTKAGNVRLYAVRNWPRWENAPHKEIAEHYNKFFGTKYNG